MGQEGFGASSLRRRCLQGGARRRAAQRSAGRAPTIAQAIDIAKLVASVIHSVSCSFLCVPFLLQLPFCTSPAIRFMQRSVFIAAEMPFCQMSTEGIFSRGVKALLASCVLPGDQSGVPCSEDLQASIYASLLPSQQLASLAAPLTVCRQIQFTQLLLAKSPSRSFASCLDSSARVAKTYAKQTALL